MLNRGPKNSNVSGMQRYFSNVALKTVLNFMILLYLINVRKYVRFTLETG